MIRIAHEFVWSGALALLVTAAMIAFGFVLLLPATNETKVRALCDQEVEALLHSTDLVEVTRAGIIVRYLDCGVRRRL